MHQPTATLHLLCGKIASGKSNLAERLGAESRAVVISEDRWLKTLFGDDMSTIADFVYRSEKLRDAMHPHVLSLLSTGISVVLDFQANTVDSRAWLRSLADQAGVPHILHYLDVPDEVCKTRLRERNRGGHHDFTVSDEQFDLITGHFKPPSADEKFNVVVYPFHDKQA